MNKLNKNFILQKDQSDCGVACLQNIINFYGGQKCLETLRELSGTTKYGTTMLGLYQAAQGCNMLADGFETGTEWLKNNIKPVILHVIIDNRLLHYVICFGWKENNFIIGDPAKGIYKMNETELNTIWQSKTLLLLQPGDGFEKSDNIKTEKKRWFLSLVREDYSLLVIIFVISLITAILGMVMAIFSQRLIDNILPEKDMEKLITGLILLTVLLIARSFTNYLAGLFNNIQGRDFNNRLIGRFYNSLMYLPKSFFDNRRIGELVARMNDTSRIQSTIAAVVGELLHNALLVIAAEFVLFIYAPLIGCFSLAVIPFYISILLQYHKKAVNAQHEVMVTNANKTSYYVNTMQNIGTIKAEIKENYFSKLNTIIYGLFQDKIFVLGKIGISLQMIIEMVGVFATVGILAVGSWMVLSDKLSLGSLMAIIGIISSLFPAITSLVFANIILQGAKVAFDRMFEFTSVVPEYKHDKRRITKKISFESLRVDNISFRFPGRKQIIQHVSFHINKEESIAIIGESGEGKTTILNILQGFYAPENGLILLNDKEYKEYYLPEIRYIMGITPQDASIFNGSLIENLTLESDMKTMEACIEFCREKGFEKYFLQFPQGYATILGEEGINLSGGQKQLVAICRTLFKKPQLLLLDEPTSAMDLDMENFVLALLKQYKKTTGIIFVTHQLKIAKQVDRLYILDNKTIHSFGTPDDLLRNINLYSRLYYELMPKTMDIK